MEWCGGIGANGHLGDDLSGFSPHQQPRVGGEKILLDATKGDFFWRWAELLLFFIYLAGVIDSIDEIA